MINLNSHNLELKSNNIEVMGPDYLTQVITTPEFGNKILRFLGDEDRKITTVSKKYILL